MLTPGPIAFLIYKILTDWYPNLVLGLAGSRITISSVVAGFSFTMLGFLATVITIIFSFTQTKTFERYRKRGHLSLLFFCYLVTIASLVVTSFLALANFSEELHVWLFRLLLMSATNNIVQIALLSIVISNIARHASHET